MWTAQLKRELEFKFAFNIIGKQGKSTIFHIHSPKGKQRKSKMTDRESRTIEGTTSRRLHGRQSAWTEVNERANACCGRDHVHAHAPDPAV